MKLLLIPDLALIFPIKSATDLIITRLNIGEWIILMPLITNENAIPFFFDD